MSPDRQDGRGSRLIQMDSQQQAASLEQPAGVEGNVMTLASGTESSQERRLTARIEKEWRGCSGAPYPRRCDIDRAKFGNDWDFCFIVDLSDSTKDSRFSYVGAALKEPGSPIFERQRISECSEGSVLALAAKEIEKVKELKQSIEQSGRAVHEDSEILYRAILLPLSENGLAIDGVLGAIGYREIAL